MTASLRAISATISDIHRFFTDDKVIKTGVDLTGAVTALRQKVLDTAQAFDEEGWAHKPLMSPTRLAWDEQKSKELEGALREFTTEMKRTVETKPAVNNVGIGSGASDKVTIGIINKDIASVLNASGARNPGPYRDNPFMGIVQSEAPSAPGASGGFPARAAATCHA
jgi:hypothetical protein